MLLCLKGSVLLLCQWTTISKTGRSILKNRALKNSDFAGLFSASFLGLTKTNATNVYSVSIDLKCCAASLSLINIIIQKTSYLKCYKLYYMINKTIKCYN